MEQKKEDNGKEEKDEHQYIDKNCEKIISEITQKLIKSTQKNKEDFESLEVQWE